MSRAAVANNLQRTTKGIMMSENFRELGPFKKWAERDAAVAVETAKLTCAASVLTRVANGDNAGEISGDIYVLIVEH